MAQEIDYSGAEVRALIAPLLGFEPDQLCGYAIVGITHDCDIQASGNGDPATTVMLLQAAATAVAVSAALSPDDAQESLPAPEPNPLESVDSSADALLRAIFGG